MRGESIIPAGSSCPFKNFLEINCRPEKTPVYKLNPVWRNKLIFFKAVPPPLKENLLFFLLSPL
jgi:hypothetical protein